MLARCARSSRALRGVAAQGIQKPRNRRSVTEDPLDGSALSRFVAGV